MPVHAGHVLAVEPLPAVVLQPQRGPCEPRVQAFAVRRFHVVAVAVGEDLLDIVGQIGVPDSPVAHKPVARYGQMQFAARPGHPHRHRGIRSMGHCGVVEGDFAERAPVDLAHDGEHVVCHAQSPVSDSAGLPAWRVGDASAANGRVDAERREFAAESREVMGVHAGRVDAGAQPVLEVAASGAQVEFPDRRGHAPGLFRHEGVQPVFAAQPVADLPPFAQGPFPQTQGLARDPVCRADEDVVVHVGPVGVGGDHVVVRASGDLPDEPFPDQMRQSGRDLIGGIERLDHVQRQHGPLPA